MIKKMINVLTPIAIFATGSAYASNQELMVCTDANYYLEFANPNKIKMGQTILLKITNKIFESVKVHFAQASSDGKIFSFSGKDANFTVVFPTGEYRNAYVILKTPQHSINGYCSCELR